MKKKELLEKIEALEVRILLLEAQVGALRNVPPQTPYTPWWWDMDNSGKLTIPRDGDGTVTITNSDLKIRTE